MNDLRLSAFAPRRRFSYAVSFDGYPFIEPLRSRIKTNSVIIKTSFVNDTLSVSKTKEVLVAYHATFYSAPIKG